MKRLIALLPFVIPFTAASADDEAKQPVYELRTYHAHPEKLGDLNARFRDHTCALFEKHGIKNVAYWVPADKKENKLIYLVSYPSREAREESWKSFFSDPAWSNAYQASIKNGKLVAKVTNKFLTPTDYSPDLKIEAEDDPRLFELRTYTTNEGKLDDLHKRFRDHTCELFEKHGMTNVLYCNLMEDQEAAGRTLVYVIAHKNAKARRASWKGFRDDAKWKSARRASEKAGPILVQQGVKSVLLKPVDYSPMR